jgi:hypothetical protein
VNGKDIKYNDLFLKICQTGFIANELNRKGDAETCSASPDAETTPARQHGFDTRFCHPETGSEPCSGTTHVILNLFQDQGLSNSI